MRNDRSEYTANRHLRSVPRTPRPMPAPPRKRRAWWKYVAVAFLIYMAIAWLGKMQREDDALAARQYCEMVHLWKTSAGDLGWPDYAGTYARQCTPAGAVRAALP